MLLNARDNLFEFNLPRVFVPEHITNKYKPYLNRIPGNIIEEPIDFINYTIQAINLPGFSYDPVEQIQPPGRKQQFRSSLPETELFQKELIVQFQLVDGYINYWMLLEILKYYYSFDTKQPYLENLNLRLTDGEGNALVTAQMKAVLMRQIDDLNMSFANNVAEFKTFNVTFIYNWLDIIIDVA
jgi:hypothetical protein